MIWNKFSFMNSKAHDPGSYSLNIHYRLWHRSAFFICPNKSRKYRISQCYICYYIFIPNKENILFVVDVWMTNNRVFTQKMTQIKKNIYFVYRVKRYQRSITLATLESSASVTHGALLIIGTETPLQTS